ncbi:hypothetical protein BDB01DRAFT_450599 [Pilobolus umbonatus]|nr:hypothetical protein BDB01DRAFT_450599 [Pilobolus umbonatus]
MAALSFCYAPPVSGQYTQYVNNNDTSSIISELQNTCQAIMSSRGCQISVTTPDTKNSNIHTTLVDTPIDYNLTLTGSTQSLIEARGDLLRNCSLQIKLTLQIPPTLSSSLTHDSFTDISKELNTTISVIPQKPHESSLISNNPITIEIIGNPIQVERCRVRVLVALDEMKSFKTETVKIPLKLQYLICGRKRAGLLPIIEETATNIYFPSPFIDIHKDETSDIESIIYITGESNHVLRVKDMLNKLAVQKAKSMYLKDTALYSRKIDWLLLHRRDELRKIMHDNGAYIEFPVIGSDDNRVTVYAENRVNAERTLRALNFQACNIYEAFFYFNHRDMYDNTQKSFFDSTTNLASLVSQLSQVSGSEVIYKADPGCIEVLGTERAIRNVYQRLQEMQFLHVFHQQTIFRVESSNEQRDFISGKKNGKINKIMKTSGAKIRFMPYMNDYNFIIEVESTSFTKALDGLTLLQEELPAEISFYVPESYHKRIIGVGGKNIQRIMKKYGVYVKFSNTEEFASLGGYYNNEDNVVARTPMKNQINLDNLRHAVMELIHPKDRDYVIEVISIPFVFHRTLIHDYQDNFITEELIKKINTQVLWPDAELASSGVQLLGPEAHLSAAVKLLETIVPEIFDLHLPMSGTIGQLVQSESFDELVRSLGQDFRIEPHVDSTDDDAIIRIWLTRDKLGDPLHDVLQKLIGFLQSHDVNLYDNTSADHLITHHKVNHSTDMMNHRTSNVMKPSVMKPQSNVSMIRSANDTVYTSPHIPVYQPFFHFSESSTSNQHPPSLQPSSSSSSNLDGWKPLAHQNGPIPSASSSAQSTGSSQGGDNLRSIFDAPIDLTDQERAVLHNYRYQRMTIPISTSSNFGFPQPVPNSSTPSDIWSTPSTNRRSTGYNTNPMPNSSSSTGRRTTSNYSSNSQNENGSNLHSIIFNDTNFYPVMGMNTGEFNPYDSSLKTNHSEPILENHFNQNRPPSHYTPPFNPNFNQPLHLGNYRPLYMGRSSPPSQPTFFNNNDEAEVVQSMLENLSSKGSSGNESQS